MFHVFCCGHGVASSLFVCIFLMLSTFPAAWTLCLTMALVLPRIYIALSRMHISLVLMILLSSTEHSPMHVRLFAVVLNFLVRLVGCVPILKNRCCSFHHLLRTFLPLCALFLLPWHHRTTVLAPVCPLRAVTRMSCLSMLACLLSILVLGLLLGASMWFHSFPVILHILPLFCVSVWTISSPTL